MVVFFLRVLAAILTSSGPFRINLIEFYETALHINNKYLFNNSMPYNKKAFPCWLIIKSLFQKFVNISFFLGFWIHSINWHISIMAVIHRAEYYKAVVRLKRCKLKFLFSHFKLILIFLSQNFHGVQWFMCKTNKKKL